MNDAWKCTTNGYKRYLKANWRFWIAGKYVGIRKYWNWRERTVTQRCCPCRSLQYNTWLVLITPGGLKEGLWQWKVAAWYVVFFLIIHLYCSITDMLMPSLSPSPPSFTFFLPESFCAPEQPKITYLAREHSPGSIKIRLNSIAVQDSSVPYATLICWQTHHPHNLASTTIQLQRSPRFNHNHAITSTPSSSSLFHLAFVVISPLISSSWVKYFRQWRVKYVPQRALQPQRPVRRSIYVLDSVSKRIKMKISRVWLTLFYFHSAKGISAELFISEMTVILMDPQQDLSCEAVRASWTLRW